MVRLVAASTTVAAFSMTLPSLLPLVCCMLKLTCFGDRVFYQDWWNAATIGAYWRTWWVGVLAPICLPDAAACWNSCLTCC